METPTAGYFNAASHGVPLAAAYERAIEYLRDEAEFGPHVAEQRWAERLYAVRVSAARLVGGRVDEIGFHATTSTAWLALLARMDLAGKRVLVAPHDWADYYGTLKARGDVTIEVLPELSPKTPDFSAWEARMEARTGGDVAAIFVPMVTAIGGVRYPVEAIGKLARAAGIKIVVDGAQALGQVPVDVRAIGCDAFVATGRKWLRGPRQVSLVWVDNQWVLDAGGFGDATIEPADKNLALLIGLGVAIDHLLDVGIETVQAAIMRHSNRIRDWAKARNVAVIDGETGSVSLALEARVARDVSAQLARAGIIAKVLDGRRFEPLDTSLAQGIVGLRISPHTYTNDGDIEMLFNVLDRAFGFRN